MRFTFIVLLSAVLGCAACVGADETHQPGAISYSTTGSTPVGGSTGVGTTTGSGMATMGGNAPLPPGGTTTGGGSTTTGGNAMPDLTPQPGVTLVPRLQITMCMDIAGGSATPGTAVRIWACNGLGIAQSWQLMHGQVRASSDRCLDLAGTAAVGTQLVTNACDPKMPANQQWLLQDGALKSATASTPFCVGLHGDVTSQGTAVELAICAPGDDAQHWNTNNTGTAVQGFAIVDVADPNHCLTMGADSAVNLAPCNDPNAKQWTLDGSAAGTAVMNGTQCMAVNGTGVMMAACNGAAAQQWGVVGGQIQTATGTACVTAPDPNAKPPTATLGMCDPANMAQQWSLGAAADPNAKP